MRCKLRQQQARLESARSCPCRHAPLTCTALASRCCRLPSWYATAVQAAQTGTQAAARPAGPSPSQGTSAWKRAAASVSPTLCGRGGGETRAGGQAQYVGCMLPPWGARQRRPASSRHQSRRHQAALLLPLPLLLPLLLLLLLLLPQVPPQVVLLPLTWTTVSSTILALYFSSRPTTVNRLSRAGRARL